MTLRRDNRHLISTTERRRAALLGRPRAAFLHVETAGGLVLLVASAIALVWANSPWAGTYRDLWSTEITVGVDGHTITTTFVSGSTTV